MPDGISLLSLSDHYDPSLPSRLSPNRLFVLALTVAAMAASAGAETTFHVVDTGDLRLVYPGERFEYLIPHIAACVDNSLEFHQKLFDWKPSEKKLTVFLQDWRDTGYGAANAVPRNFLNLGLSPMNLTYETLPALDRYYWLGNHEVAHVAAMDAGAGRDLASRKFFAGKVTPIAEDPISFFYSFLTNPRWNSPRWYHEGMAVFLETWMDGGIGRALGAWDEMVFRSMVNDGAYFYRVVGLESEGTTVDFQSGVNSYLYGTRFMTYLAYTYGPEKVIEWIARPPGSKAQFQSQFKHVFGAPLDQEWERWIVFEHEYQETNLESIRENPVTVHRDLTKTAVGSVSRAYIDRERGKAYFAVDYPGQVSHLAELDLATGELAKIMELKGPAIYFVTSLAFDPETRTLFYTTSNWEWRDLWSLDLATGKKTLIGPNIRMGDLAFNRSDRSLWGIQRADGHSILVRLPHPYQEYFKIWTFPYGTDMYDVDISPDGSVLAAGLAEIDGSQNLMLFRVEDLLAGRNAPEKLFDFDESLAANFVFSPDGKSLYGTSYYSGASNVYRYDLEQRDIFVLTNAETGYFRPQPLSDDELFALRYTGKGFVPVAIANREIEKVSGIRYLGNELAKKAPVVKTWAAGTPRAAEYQAYEPEVYHSAASLQLESIYPIVRGYKDSASAGLRANLSDPTGLDALVVTATYSPDSELDSDERHHLDVSLRHWNWNFRGTWNRDDFYDLFGPTKNSRRGYSLGFDWGRILVLDDPRFWRFKTGSTFWGDLETLPGYQEIEAPSKKLVNAWTRLEYDFLRRSRGAVDMEKGSRFTVEAIADVVEDDVIPRLDATFDLGFPLPLDHSSIWLRTAAGHAFGDVDDAFSNFFFGGFGNNYVDRLTEKRYRETESFPGLEINEVGGRNFAKAMVEWNLPPVRFRSAGRPALYLNWLRPALFGGVLQTNLDQHGELRRTVSMVGGQLDLKVVLFTNMPSILSFGYATAFEENGSSDEVMISLKLLQ
jgi:hypothetical protein